ncbi:predicted protein [Uncinocarpus reesii 1704]|uniref:Uncharacterized protein n=1 Tax=Uncinocarpus reesii (strain UAMH 1704) TaxID=336963 RepID=C4JGV2_UNCRE|nr:uncharacterized protein UREG_02614 [Uncinocarpus reesii 1704]EEP77765.1 predicted protein [Uncinocarpus reesii 1704]
MSATSPPLMSSGNSPHVKSQGSAKERAVAVERMQKEALAALPLNSLYIGLWIRSDPPVANDFHWAYYFHSRPLGGTKYHIRNLGSGWIVDHEPTNGIFGANFLCVLIEIATVPETKHGELDQIIRSYDANVNSIPGVTCRVWLLEVAQKLIDHGIIHCNSHLELGQECMAIGNQHMHGASINEQPRPVVKSRLCH